MTGTQVDLLPEHQVHGPVLVLHGPGDEPEGMILPPGLSLFRQTSLGNTGHGDCVGVFCLD